MSTKWDELKRELKRNIKPLFDNEYSYSFTFDEGIDVFISVLLKELNINDLDDRKDIIQALEGRFVDKNFERFGNILVILSLKLESYIKRVFSILGEDIRNNTFAPTLKKIFRDKGLLSSSDINKFFNKDENNKPITRSEYFKDKMPFGEHLKIVYDIRNMEGHLDPNFDDEYIMSLIKSVVIIYIYITFLYYDKLLLKVEANKIADNFNTEWSEFSSVCNEFEDNYAYFLITGPNLKLSRENEEHFANINWSFVFDFDMNSDNDGLFSIVKPKLEKSKAVVSIINSEDKSEISFSNNSTFWFFSRGVSGISDSLPSSHSVFEWKEKYSDFTKELMSNYSKFKNFKPITVIVLFDDIRYINEIIHCINTAFGNNVRYVFATQCNSDFKDIINDSIILSYSSNISFNNIAEGFRLLAGKFFKLDDDNLYLPCLHQLGKSRPISQSDAQKVKRYFDIIHLNITSEVYEEKGNEKDFYQGRTITWQEIADGGYAVNRDIVKDVSNYIREWLLNRSTGGIIYLYHEPGAGGTTAGRLVAMNFYEKYPTLVLKYYNKVKTVEELHRVFSLTNQPIFVLIDDSEITISQIKELSIICEDRLIKAVFLVVERSFNKPECGQNVFFMPLKILKKEELRFINRFSQKFKEKEEIFKEIYSRGNSKELTPFFLGLIAYEKEYISITDYVKIRLKDITPGQKEVLKIISLFSYYGKRKYKEVPSYIFKDILIVKEDYVILQNYIRDKKVQDLILELDNLCWRTLHFLIAEEILVQTLGTNEKGEFNPALLKELSIMLINSLKNLSQKPKTEIIEMMRNIFIYRSDKNEEINSYDDEPVDGVGYFTFNPKVFAKLITDLMYNENRIIVLENLVKCFPAEEPHFWGHLSRIYSVDGQFPRSQNSIDNGLRIIKSDESRKDYFVLYHIKGMCYRSQAYVIKDIYYGNKDCPEDKIKEFRDLFNKAEEQFAQTRKLVPKKEHGYISYIQFVCQAIDFGFSISDVKKEEGYAKFLSSSGGKWFNEILSNANELISKLRWFNTELAPSMNVKKQQTKLLKYYDNPGRLISSWYALLGNNEVDQNYVRRNIVNAYIAKNKFIIETIDKEYLIKIEELLYKNIKNLPDDKDVRQWIEIARILKVNEERILSVLHQGEFFKETLEIAYYLYCYYAIKCINGSELAKEKYYLYKEKCKQLKYFPASKIFCAEWIYEEGIKKVLLNHRSVGEWQKEKGFFSEELPNKLAILNGKVKTFIDRNQGYIEIEDCGIEVFYVPGSANHYSDNKGDKVEFYMGFTYDGPRAFKVKSI